MSHCIIKVPHCSIWWIDFPSVFTIDANNVSFDDQFSLFNPAWWCLESVTSIVRKMSCCIKIRKWNPQSLKEWTQVRTTPLEQSVSKISYFVSMYWWKISLSCTDEVCWFTFEIIVEMQSRIIKNLEVSIAYKC